MASVFVSLGRRWAVAAISAEKYVQIPSRIVVGERGQRETDISALKLPHPVRFQFAEGLLRVGGAAIAPGCFIPRSGSILPIQDSKSAEDALLILALLERLGCGHKTDDVVLITTDHSWALHVWEALLRISSLIRIEGRRQQNMPFPRLLRAMSRKDEKMILSSIKPQEQGHLAVLHCHNGQVDVLSLEHGESVLAEVNLPDLFPEWDQHLQDAMAADGKALYWTSDWPGEDGRVAPIRTLADDQIRIDSMGATETQATASFMADMRKTHADSISQLRALCDCAVLLGEDWQIYAELLSGLDHLRPLKFPNPLQAIPILASNLAKSDQLEMPVIQIQLPKSTVPSSAEVAEHEVVRPLKPRRLAPVRFNEKGQEILIRFPIRLLDESLVETLRAFAMSTKPSDDAILLLDRLIEISPRKR